MHSSQTLLETYVILSLTSMQTLSLAYSFQSYLSHNNSHRNNPMQILERPYNSHLMWLFLSSYKFCSVVSQRAIQCQYSPVTSTLVIINNQYYSNITSLRALPATFMLCWAQYTSTHAPLQEKTQLISKFNLLRR